MRKAIYVLTLAILSSCGLSARKEEVLMTDKDFVENYRAFSPDSSMVLINYSLDLGLYDYSRAATAILKLSDTTKNLTEYTIPSALTQVKWIGNGNISAQFDILPSLRTGEEVELRDIDINGVKVRVSALDYIDKDDRQEIEHREVSPNGRYELVAYRYVKDSSSSSFIHISVIPLGHQIPKYGNFLMADRQSDYVLYGTWTKDNELVFYSNSLYSDLIPGFLVDNRPKVKYRIVRDDVKYGRRNRWIEKTRT